MFPKDRKWPVAFPSQLSVIARYYRHFLVSAEVIVDVTAIAAAVLTGYWIFLANNPVPAEWRSYILVALLTSLVGVLVFERMGLYRQQASLMNLIEIRKIIDAVLLLYLMFLLYSFFGKAEFPRMVVVYSFALTLLFVLVERMCFFKLQQALYLRGFNVSRILIIGAGEEGRFLCQNIYQAPKLGYYVVGFLDEKKHHLDVAKQWFSKGKKSDPFFFDDFSSLADIVDDFAIKEIFISNPLYSDGGYDLRWLAEFCRGKKIKLNFSPILRGHYAAQAQVNDINGIPMISLGAVPISQAEQISKRIFDLTLVTLLLPFLIPVFALITLMIRRDSGGPVVFQQIRVGKDGVHFPMYKFRSMHVNSPQYEYSPQSSEDPRITKVGRFLRRTSLDELPQIFNVLRGEMSLVGPRPEMPFIVENEYTDFHRERLKVKPGITGVWQISGDRSKRIHENISYDIFYIENRSLILDVIILVRTLLFGIIAMRTH